MPGEFTQRLTGDQYGFESLSFIISETHQGGGPGLHVHDVEEAHVLLEGTAQYRVGDKTFTVQAPYVAKVPAGVPHTFINAGTEDAGGCLECDLRNRGKRPSALSFGASLHSRMRTR
ncbi:MAG TPA: cupin domain-containing protein [Polyangiaceae bacterium]